MNRPAGFVPANYRLTGKLLLILGGIGLLATGVEGPGGTAAPRVGRLGSWSPMAVVVPKRAGGGDRGSVTLLRGEGCWECGGIRNRAGSFVTRLLSLGGGESGREAPVHHNWAAHRQVPSRLFRSIT